MDYDQLFPGRFLKSGEFQGRDVTLTIAGVRTEDLPQEKGGDRTRGIIAFRETQRELVLNRTNGECFKALFGRETNAWIGKRVTLYPAPHKDSFTGEVGTAIRVRGSPELAADKRVEIRLPRKKPTHVTLKATGAKQQRAAPQQAPEPTTHPAFEDAPPPELEPAPPEVTQ